jgi:hypothetical protein
MKKFHLFFILLTISGFVSAQSSFLVYSFKGSVKTVEGSTEAAAKIGKVMNSNGSIKIGSASAVTLICNEAAMFTITKAGTYKLSSFGDSCMVSKSSVSANYVKYVWAQMTKPSGSAGSNRKLYMNNVGAVSRDPNPVWVDPILDTVNYVSGDFPLSWKCYAEADKFDFMLFKSTNIAEPFYTTEVSKKKISIQSLVPKMKIGESYYWIPTMKEVENENRKVLNYVSKDTYNTLLESFKKQAAPGETPAEQAYRLGFMMEDAHFLSEAHQYYSKAVALDNKNALYMSTLMSFKKDYEIK